MEKFMLGYIALLVLNVLLSPFFNKKKGVLFCGLFGFSGDEKPNLAKLKILGIKNEKRGVDSCGVYYNNTLTKGVYLTKVFSDFLETVTFDASINPTQNVFIGHTRWSTVGSNTADNAHPFLLRENHILAHNGTIDNIDDLLKKYDIDKKENKIEVDSQGLGHLFIQNGRSILEEYRGYAAFLYHDRRDKDALWIFKGASKKWDYVTAQPLEERPLFYAVHREGIYFCSTPEPLKIIKDGPNQDPIEVPTNMLIKVVGSTFGVEAYEIKRENNNIGIDSKKTTVVYPQYPIQRHTPSITQPISHKAIAATQTGTTNSRMGKVINIPFKDTEPKKVDLDISKETYPPKCYDATLNTSDEDYVYWWKGRFHFGSDELCHGVMYLNKEGIISSEEMPGFYEAYFYRGVMIDGKKMYDSLMFEIETGSLQGMKVSLNSFNFAKHIAPYSKYPVTNLLTDSVNVAQSEIPTLNLWWMRDTRNKKHLVHVTANHSFTPMYGGAYPRNYIFRQGVLEKIQCSSKTDSPFPVEGSIRNPHINAFHKDDVEILPSTEEESSALLDAKVRTLSGFFRRKYITIDEFNAEIPSTIMLALSYYLEDFLLITEGEVSNERVLSLADTFIKNVVDDFVSIEDNMIDAPGILSIDEYIKAAIRGENSEANDKKKESTFNTKELDDAIAEEDEIKKTLKMARTFTSLFTRKANAMKIGNNPLGKKLAEEFESCAELLTSSINESIDNQNQKDIITSKSELKNIIK